MKKLTAFILSILLLLSLTACGGTQNTQTSSESGGKVFVVYFSASGNTERVAREIAAVTDGTLFALTPTEPYTTEDLNWSDADSRVSPASASPTVPMRRRSGLGRQSRPVTSPDAYTRSAETPLHNIEDGMPAGIPSSICYHTSAKNRRPLPDGGFSAYRVTVSLTGGSITRRSR